MDAQPYLDLIAKHQWVALSALVIGLLVRLLKEDTRFPPFAIPARWRPVLAVGLGVVSGVLQAASTGTPWRDAVLGGLVSAFLAIAGHETVVNSLRDGKDVPMPAALIRKPAVRVASLEPPTPPDPSVRQR
jgi:hypothetical protein